MTEPKTDKARDLAVRLLYGVLYEGGYSNLKIGEMMRSSGLSAADGRLCAQIVYGVLERLFLLDFYISRFSTLKLKKISPFVLIILRCGIYQLLYLDRVPDHAVCDQSVNLAKKYAHLAAAGFVNGLLRTVLRNKDNLPVPEFEKEAENLSVTYTVDPSLIRLWTEQYGEVWVKELLPSFSRIPEPMIRRNTLASTRKEFFVRMERDGVGLTESPLLPEAFFISFTGDIGELPAFRDGWFTVQGIASQLCALLLAPMPGQRVLDLCAAPGGKTFLLAQLMENRGEIFAFDIHSHKIELIQKGAKRLGLTNIKAYLGDGTIFNPELLEKAHRVLVDAPCSGLGTIAQKPEIRFKTADSIAGLPDVQLRILANGARYLQKGGILVYSTCTLNKKENEEVVDKFLTQNPGFELCELGEEAAPFLADDPSQKKKGMITLFPPVHKTDGFFICKMRRKNGD